MSAYQVQLTFVVEGTDQQLREVGLQLLAAAQDTRWQDDRQQFEMISTALSMPTWTALFQKFGVLQLDRRLAPELAPLAIRYSRDPQPIVVTNLDEPEPTAEPTTEPPA